MTFSLMARYLKQTQFISSCIHWWVCIVRYRQPPDEPKWFKSQEWMTNFFFDEMSCQDYESIDQALERLLKESVVHSEVEAVCPNAVEQISMD